MNRRFYIYLFTFCLLLSFISCREILKDSINAVNANRSKTPENLSDSSYKIIRVDSIYSLAVPKYMKEMKSLHDEASLEYANIYKEAYTIVIHENIFEFAEYFKELEEYDDDLSSLENYVKIQKSFFNETIENLKIQDYGLMDINNYPARQIKIRGKIDGIDIGYVIAFIKGSENIYMIMNWTLLDRIGKYENTFEYINGTFKLLNQ